jgi:hypothetical protein
LIRHSLHGRSFRLQTLRWLIQFWYNQNERPIPFSSTRPPTLTNVGRIRTLVENCAVPIMPWLPPGVEVRLAVMAAPSAMGRAIAAQRSPDSAGDPLGHPSAPAFAVAPANRAQRRDRVQDCQAGWGPIRWHLTRTTARLAISPVIQSIPRELATGAGDPRGRVCRTWSA